MNLPISYPFDFANNTDLLKLKRLFVIASFSFLFALSLTSQTSSCFDFTGGVQTWTVPPGVSEVFIEAWGAQGANAPTGGVAGLGGETSGILSVLPGQVLYFYVGGQNGYNGGGLGGLNGNVDNSSSTPSGNAGNGGGASDVRINGTSLSDRVIVAGGGGGGGNNGTWIGCQIAGPGGNGGDGGGSTANDGTFGLTMGPCNCQNASGDKGGGGSQIAGGLAGGYQGSGACLRNTWTVGFPGSLGLGGDGSRTFHNGTGGGGGGGGGYFGGGSGGSGSDTTPGGGGGGGSSYIGGVTSGSSLTGVQSGDGQICITYNIGSIPTLSEWGMLILALSLMIIGIVFMKYHIKKYERTTL